MKYLFHETQVVTKIWALEAPGGLTDQEAQDAFFSGEVSMNLVDEICHNAELDTIERVS